MNHALVALLGIVARKLLIAVAEIARHLAVGDDFKMSLHIVNALETPLAGMRQVRVRVRERTALF